SDEAGVGCSDSDDRGVCRFRGKAGVRLGNGEADVEINDEGSCGGEEGGSDSSSSASGDK
ncbi:MAG: hypothetical protein SGPRY_011359, partial [Prymnesium sp.]